VRENFVAYVMQRLKNNQLPFRFVAVVGGATALVTFICVLFCAAL
jgi:hypothetical protein